MKSQRILTKENIREMVCNKRVLILAIVMITTKSARCLGESTNKENFLEIDNARMMQQNGKNGCEYKCLKCGSSGCEECTNSAVTIIDGKSTCVGETIRGCERMSLQGCSRCQVGYYQEAVNNYKDPPMNTKMFYPQSTLLNGSKYYACNQFMLPGPMPHADCLGAKKTGSNFVCSLCSKDKKPHATQPNCIGLSLPVVAVTNCFYYSSTGCAECMKGFGTINTPPTTSCTASTEKIGCVDFLCTSCNGNSGYFATKPSGCTKYEYVYTPLKPTVNTNTVANTTSVSSSSENKWLGLFGLIIVNILIFK